MPEIQDRHRKQLSVMRGFLEGREFYLAAEALELVRKTSEGFRKDLITPQFHHQLSVTRLVTTLLPQHPIAAGLPTQWDIPQTEMYGEPFHVPAPDEVVFEEKWDKGEHFRSGCVWQVGKGRVFYFRPGHETYPIYQQAEPLRVVENAVRWMSPKTAR